MNASEIRSGRGDFQVALARGGLDGHALDAVRPFSGSRAQARKLAPAADDEAALGGSTKRGRVEPVATRDNGAFRGLRARSGRARRREIGAMIGAGSAAQVSLGVGGAAERENAGD